MKLFSGDSNEFNEEFDTVDLNKILRVLLPNYANILVEERFNQRVELLSCVNTEGQFIYVCPNHSLVLGYDPVELYGANVCHLIHSGDRERIHHRLAELIDTQQPQKLKYRIMDKKGHYHNLENSYVPFVVDGEVAALIIFSKRIKGGKKFVFSIPIGPLKMPK